MQVPNGTGPGVRRSKRPLLASRTRCNVLWKPPKFGCKVKIGNRQKRSNEGCSKFKGPETRQVQERLVSTLIRTHASPKVGQDQVSGGVSVPCRHVTPVAGALWKPIFCEMSDTVKMLSPVMSQTGIMSYRYIVSLVSTNRTNASPKRDRTRCPEV